MKKASLISLALFAFVSFFCLKIMVQQTKVQAAQDYTAIYEKNAVETVNKISAELAEKHWEGIHSFYGYPYDDECFECNYGLLFTDEEKKKYMYTISATCDGDFGYGINIAVLIYFTPENPQGEIHDVYYYVGDRAWGPGGDHTRKPIVDACTAGLWKTKYAY